MTLNKKIFCIILCLIMLFTTSVYSFADTIENDEGKTNYEILLEKGYSESFLNNLTDEYMQRLVAVIGDNKVGSIETTETKFYDDSVTLDTISAALLTLNITATNVCKLNSTEISSVVVTITWEWAANKPVYRGKDAISVNWDENVFTYTGGFYSQDCYKSNASDEWTLFKEYDSAAEANQGGIGAWTDLKALKKYVGGTMMLVLSPTSTMKEGTANSTGINVNYVHASAPLTGISFGAVGVSVGISWDRSCDSSSKTYYYRYSK